MLFQAMFSASLLDELLQTGRRGPLSKLTELYDGNSESQVEIEVFEHYRLFETNSFYTVNVKLRV